MAGGGSRLNMSRTSGSASAAWLPTTVARKFQLLISVRCAIGNRDRQEPTRDSRISQCRDGIESVLKVREERPSRCDVPSETGGNRRRSHR